MTDPDAGVLAAARAAEDHARGERRNADVKTYASVGLAATGLGWAASHQPSLSLGGQVVWGLGLAAGVVAVLLLWWTGMPGIVWRAKPGACNVFELHAAARAGRLRQVLADAGPGGGKDREAAAVAEVASMSRLAVFRYRALWAGQALAVVAAAFFGLALLIGGLA